MADFLLLHGMNVGAFEWDRLAPLLRASPRVGQVIAPDMPGRGPDRPAELSHIRLNDYLETALRALREHDLRDVILVGHSAGGICLQAVATAEPERVRRLVFLCAAVPQRGRNVLAWQPRPVRLLFRLLLAVTRARRRGIRPNRRFARWALCNTLQPPDCALVLDSLVPEPAALLTDPIDWAPGRAPTPATYIHTTRDRVIRHIDQLRMAATVPGVELLPLDAGHADPVMYPERLAALLLAYT